MKPLLKPLSKVALQHMESLQESKRVAQKRDQTYAKMVTNLRQRWPGLYEQFNAAQPYDLAAEPTRRIGRVRPTTSPTTDPLPYTPPMAPYTAPTPPAPPRHTDAFDLRKLSLAHTLGNLLRTGVAAGKGIPTRIQMAPETILLLVQANFVQAQNFVWCSTVLIPLEAIPSIHSDAIFLVY